MRDITTRKDGTSFDVEVHATPFTYKGKPHLLAIVRDITEQVQAEQQLREQEDQYRGVFEAASDGLVITNLDGLLSRPIPPHVRCTVTYEELLGLHRTILTHREYHYLVPESSKRSKQAVIIKPEQSTSAKTAHPSRRWTRHPVHLQGPAYYPGSHS